MEEYNPNQIEEEFIIDGDSVTKETYQSFKALERQLAEAREEIQDLKNIGNMFKCFVPANIADLYNEQLK